MKSPSENYSHVLEIDEEKRLLTIYRVFPDRTKQLFTSVFIPRKTVSEDPEVFRSFAQTLGENVLMDSPAARRLFGI